MWVAAILSHGAVVLLRVRSNLAPTGERVKVAKA